MVYGKAFLMIKEIGIFFEVSKKLWKEKKSETLND